MLLFHDYSYSYSRPLALVRPILEDGHLQRNIALMERIQRLATSVGEDVGERPYQERLRRLNLFFFRATPSAWIPHLRL